MWRQSMSQVKATHVLFVQSFAPQRMLGISIKANSTKVAEINCLIVELEDQISEKMEKLGDTWQCRDCLWTTKYKTRLWEHVEAIHVQSHGYNCPFCAKFCPSKKAWINHKSKFHKGCWMHILINLFSLRSRGCNIRENGQVGWLLAMQSLPLGDKAQDSPLGTHRGQACPVSRLLMSLLLQVLLVKECMEAAQEQVP